MMRSILGLTLDDALEALRAAGQEPEKITITNAPRGNQPRGNLRVVRVKNGGMELVCARFPDEAAQQAAKDKQSGEKDT